MGGEGHMLDMIRRLKEGRDSANLRRARTNERMKRLQTKAPYPLPDTTPEEMGRIIRQSKEKKEADDRYEHIHDRAACTGRPPELTRERDHQRVTGAAAERAFHVQPGAERKQLQTADEHGNAAHQSMHLRDEVRRLNRIDHDRAARNVNDRA